MGRASKGKRLEDPWIFGACIRSKIGLGCGAPPTALLKLFKAQGRKNPRLPLFHTMTQEIKPPTPLHLPPDALTVFLAGSIDMGAAQNWQAQALNRIADLASIVLNPRRDDWDASWRQSIDDPQFRAQVEWELDGLERADLIAMWFERDSQSPITLLELGLNATSAKLIVGCPHGFWRRGNIEVVCKRFHIPLYENFEDFALALEKRLKELGAQRSTAR